MTPTKRRILFFTPFATRTGSEMLLLYIVQQLDRSLYDIGVVSFANGELLKEFPADVPTFVVPRKYSISQKIMFHLGANPTFNKLRQIAKEFKADYWYVNTTILPEVITIAREFPVKVITHFHELPLTYAYLSSEDMDNIITKSTLLIGCSQVTCDAITQAGGNNVDLLYEFVDIEKISPVASKTKQLRQELSIPEDDYIWVLSGMTSERKGFDLLPDIAEELNDPHVHLIWIGEKLSDGLVYYTEKRCNNDKPKSPVHLVGKQKEDYYNYLNMGDGFLLTSRQDPFPLVMIEAAYLGKPIVSFPSGGVSEFILDGMGAITEDISVRQLVAKMRKIMDGQIITDSEKSRERAKVFSVKNGYENWTKIMDKL
jgi:glycosyltransferase involved in cell wall biosynthesis